MNMNTIDPHNVIMLERERRCHHELVDTRLALSDATHKLALVCDAMKFAYGYQMSTKNAAARSLLEAIHRIDPTWQP